MLANANSLTLFLLVKSVESVAFDWVWSSARSIPGAQQSHQQWRLGLSTKTKEASAGLPLLMLIAKQTDARCASFALGALFGQPRCFVNCDCESRRSRDDDANRQQQPTLSVGKYRRWKSLSDRLSRSNRTCQWQMNSILSASTTHESMTSSAYYTSARAETHNADRSPPNNHTLISPCVG